MGFDCLHELLDLRLVETSLGGYLIKLDPERLRSREEECLVDQVEATGMVDDCPKGRCSIDNLPPR